MAIPDDLISISEAAYLADVTYEAIRSWITRDGLLRVFPPKGSKYGYGVSRSELQELLSRWDDEMAVA